MHGLPCWTSRKRSKFDSARIWILSHVHGDERTGDELETSTNSLEREVFDCSLQLKKLKKLILTPATPPSSMDFTTTGESDCLRLMYDCLRLMYVPTFDGNLPNWQTFWEQFSISIHDRPASLTTEKLVYLRHYIHRNKRCLQDQVHKCLLVSWFKIPLTFVANKKLAL